MAFIYIMSYVVIGIFLNPLFRNIIIQQNKGDGLHFRTNYTSILLSSFWPVGIGFIALFWIFALVVLVLGGVWHLGRKVFGEKEDV
jgi:hypothetical protein